MDHPISDLLNVSMKCINEMIDANTIIGTPITYNKTTIIPVSRVHLGFLSGGSDIKPNTNKAEPLFGGGTGGGLSLTPIAFLVVQDDNINLISIDSESRIADKLIDLVPKALEKVKTLVNNNIENNS
ncbi:MAG: sporulation protein YtfJ [Erysipelotrichaceae bacterium]|nr:sporulation protein YtfJ [Erysipelotrichaceae bacterium]